MSSPPPASRSLGAWPRRVPWTQARWLRPPSRPIFDMDKLGARVGMRVARCDHRPPPLPLPDGARRGRGQPRAAGTWGVNGAHRMLEDDEITKPDRRTSRPSAALHTPREQGRQSATIIGAHQSVRSSHHGKVEVYESSSCGLKVTSPVSALSTSFPERKSVKDYIYDDFLTSWREVA